MYSRSTENRETEYTERIAIAHCCSTSLEMRWFCLRLSVWGEKPVVQTESIQSVETHKLPNIWSAGGRGEPERESWEAERKTISAGENALNWELRSPTWAGKKIRGRVKVTRLEGKKRGRYRRARSPPGAGREWINPGSTAPCPSQREGTKLFSCAAVGARS